MVKLYRGGKNSRKAGFSHGAEQQATWWWHQGGLVSTVCYCIYQVPLLSIEETEGSEQMPDSPSAFQCGKIEDILEERCFAVLRSCCSACDRN